MDSSKYMFLICGAPGSGKSTLAKKLTNRADRFINPISDTCEADDYFYELGRGEYKFNPKLLGKAHEKCQEKARAYAEYGDNFIVSNTGIKPYDRKPYFNIAREFGYKVVFIHLTTEYGSIHDVPQMVIDRMRENFVEPTSDELKLLVKGDEMSDDLASLLCVSGVNYEY